MRSYCTLFDKNYLSRGIALYNSLCRESSVPFKLYVLAMDECCYYSLVKLNLTNVEVINLESDFMSPELREIKKGRPWNEFCWTCSSELIKFCFNRFELLQCTYLDSDIYFFNDPEIIFKEFSESSSALITKHNYSPENDQSDSSGIFCVQFMPFNRNDEGMSILERWNDQCLDSCTLDTANGKCGDQKYLDEWPSRYKNLKISSYLGAGLAPWNVQLVSQFDGKILLDKNGKNLGPIIFYHFHALKFFLNHKVQLSGSRYFISKIIFRNVYMPYLKELRQINEMLAKLEIVHFHGAKAGIFTDIGLKELTKDKLRRFKKAISPNRNNRLYNIAAFKFPCQVCGNLEHQISHSSLFDDRYGYPGTFDLFRCLKCSNKMLANDFNNDDLAKLYSTFYPRANFNLSDFKPLAFKGGFKGWLIGEQSSAAAWVPGHVSVLDVGCGLGASVAYHKSRNCKATGVDADHNINKIKEAFNLDLRIGVFSENMFKNEKYKYITLDQVIEHPINISRFLDQIHKLLEIDGYVIFTTPNSNGWGSYLFRRKWINWHTPYHLHFLSSKSIEILAAKYGFSIEKNKTITHSNWLFYQFIHLITFTSLGTPNGFWIGKDDRDYSSVQKILLKLVNKINRYHLFKVITRFFDCLGFGDNRLVVLKKIRV